MEKNNKALDLDQFKKRLKKCGLKVTPQRLAVHESMLRLGHASADMVTESILLKGQTKVTVASVYNILSQLTALGVYCHRMSANNKMYFDVNTFKHMHMYDTENHTFKDILDEGLQKEIEDRIASRRIRGYKIDGVDIQILAHPSSRRKK